MSLERDNFNIPPSHEMAFVDSITIAFLHYKTYMVDRRDVLGEVSVVLQVMGLESGHAGRFYKRWFKRSLTAAEEGRIEALLRVLAASASLVVLIPIMGYIWRQVPQEYQKKGWVGPGRSDRLEFFFDETVRAAGVTAEEVTYPRPDMGNLDNIIAAREARLNQSVVDGVHIGQPDAASLQALRLSVTRDLDRWTPISVMETEEWLEHCRNYSQTKKDEIRRILNDPPRSGLDTVFVKNESYDSFKAPRLISNTSKVKLAKEGPVVKTLDQQFDDLPSVLSGKPVSSWGDEVMRALGPYQNDSWNILVTDFSSFEGSISFAIKDAVENQVYAKVLSGNPVLRDELADSQRRRRFFKMCRHRDSDVRSPLYFEYDGRASGDARTYQGNTLTNHYLIRHFQETYGFKAPYFVSGDDGLMAVPSTIPPAEITRFFGRLGFSLKVEPTKIETSGFCGFNFDPNNGNKRLAADIVGTISEFFVSRHALSPKKYKDYLYDKALCMLHEYSADPVLRPALQKILTKPRVYDVHSVRRDWWDNYLMEHSNDSVVSLLASEPSSFEVSTRIHKNGLTIFEEIELAEAFAEKVQAVMSDQTSYRLDDLLRQYVPAPVRIFSDLNRLEKEDGLYAWNPDAYRSFFKA